MKIERFLTFILSKMVNYPDISFKTLKMFIDKFECYLSKKEKERYMVQIQLIKEFSLKQISLDSFVEQEKANHLEKQLNTLKGKE